MLALYLAYINCQLLISMWFVRVSDKLNIHLISNDTGKLF